MAKLQMLNKILNVSLSNRVYNSSCFKNWNKLNSFESLRMVCSSQPPPSDRRTFVYVAPLKNRVKIAKLISLSSSMVGFAILPVFLKDMWHANMVLAYFAGVLSTAFLCTPLLLNLITKKYVLELKYDPETGTFSATTFNIACQIIETNFKASDVIVPELPGMFTSFMVKNKPFFVDSNMVIDPDAFSLMMGYDRPFDFKLESERKKNV